MSGTPLFRTMLNENVDIKVIQAIKNLNITSFSANNWNIFYSDGSGDIQELSLGSANQFLMSNSASSAPSFEDIHFFKTITGITNDVVADTINDTLTLASGNSILGIVGTAGTDTITFTVDETQINHDNISNVSADDHHNREHSMTDTSDHNATAWRLFYSDGSGDIQELSFGALGEVLTSSGAAVAPTWGSAAGDFFFKTITGITNDVVADAVADTLTLASGNAILSIVGTAATDTITFTIDETQIDHDQLTNFTANEHFTMLDEDNMASDSDTQAATQQSIKAYVDGKTDYFFKTITGITNDVVADSYGDSLTLSSANAILTIVGTAATDVITFTVDESQIDHDNLINFTVDEHFTMLDEDNMASDSDTQAATQQSIKAYVDSKIDNTAYGVAWSGVTTKAPTQDTVYDWTVQEHIRVLSPTMVIPEDLITSGNNNVYWISGTVAHGKDSLTNNSHVRLYFHLPEEYVEGSDLTLNLSWINIINRGGTTVDYRVRDFLLRQGTSYTPNQADSSGSFAAGSDPNIINDETLIITGTNYDPEDHIMFYLYMEDNANTDVIYLLNTFLQITVNERD